MIDDAAQDPGANSIPRLLQAMCAYDLGDLPQGGHVFACACRYGSCRSGGVGDARSFDVRPAAQTGLKESGRKSSCGTGTVNRAHRKRGDVAELALMENQAAAFSQLHDHITGSSFLEVVEGFPRVANAGEDSGFLTADEEKVHLLDNLQNFIRDLFAWRHTYVKGDP